MILGWNNRRTRSNRATSGIGIGAEERGGLSLCCIFFLGLELMILGWNRMKNTDAQGRIGPRPALGKVLRKGERSEPMVYFFLEIRTDDSRME